MLAGEGVRLAKQLSLNADGHDFRSLANPGPARAGRSPDYLPRLLPRADRGHAFPLSRCSIRSSGIRNFWTLKIDYIIKSGKAGKNLIIIRKFSEPDTWRAKLTQAKCRVGLSHHPPPQKAFGRLPVRWQSRKPRRWWGRFGIRRRIFRLS